MLHCPRNIMRSALYSRIIFRDRPCAGPRAAIRPAIGGWRTASPISASHNATAACGARWPGKRTRAATTRNNPDVSKQSRPTLGMPILIDMKKKPGVDQWEGQVYNAKDGQFYSSTIRPLGPDHWRSRAACWASSAAAKPGPGSPRQFPRVPANSMAKGCAEGCDRACRRSRTEDHRADDHRFDRSGGKDGHKQASADPVGDICLLPDIARFAH